MYFTLLNSAAKPLSSAYFALLDSVTRPGSSLSFTNFCCAVAELSSLCFARFCGGTVKFNLCGGAQDILSTSVLMQISLCFVIIWERTEKRNAGGKKGCFFGWLIARTGRPEMRNMSQFFERGMTKRVKFQHDQHSYFCFMSLWLPTLNQSLLCGF